MSFVDKDFLEPSCRVLLLHKTQAIVGVLRDDTDPLVSITKLDKAPTETYADIGGLEQQIQGICVVGSELIQQYLGDGPKLVRDLFRGAEDHAPSIVFIDEIDAIDMIPHRVVSVKSMLELLIQLDGFDTRSDVKVIIATNRID